MMFTKNVLSMYSKTILLVDDSPLFLKILKGFFRREQVEILTAESGAEAIEIIKNQKPDLVFMDFYMPGDDGDEACRQIKSDFRLRSIPIVIVTGSDNPREIERCLKAGCNEAIHKPLNREDVLNICKKYLKFPGWSGRRVGINTPATIFKDAGIIVIGNLLDISVGGVFFETEELLPVDSEIQLEFKLKSESALIKCKGRVSWLNRENSPEKDKTSKGMGIEFIDIPKLDILTIQAFVREGGHNEISDLRIDCRKESNIRDIFGVAASEHGHEMDACQRNGSGEESFARRVCRCCDCWRPGQ